MHAITSSLFLLLTLSFIIGCNAKSGDNEIIGEIPTSSGLTLVSNFDEVTTGWKDASGNSISVTLNSTANAQSLECRYAHTTALSSAPYSTCNIVGGKVSMSQPSSGIVNGTFEFQAKATVDGEEIIKSVKFYVHDSLNSAGKCAPLKTDAQYFALAASYLDQSLAFDSGTALKNPFVKLSFPTVPTGNYIFTNGTATDNIPSALDARDLGIKSLRKRFTSNAAKTLIMIRRAYESRFNPGNCPFRIPNHATSESTGAPVDLAAGETPRLPGLDRPWLGYNQAEILCDAVVFNSLKKGVCFSGTQIHFLRGLGRAFQTYGFNSGGIRSFSQRITSSKFSIDEKAEYDATIAQAISNGDTQAKDHYIYLDD